MSIVRFLVKRLAFSVFVLLGLSILIFTISRVLPGDPVRMALGSRAPEWAVENMRREMHLDEPFYKQYVFWLSGAVRGDLGLSLVTRRAVSKDIREFVPAFIGLTHQYNFHSVVVEVIKRGLEHERNRISGGSATSLLDAVQVRAVLAKIAVAQRSDLPTVRSKPPWLHPF